MTHYCTCSLDDMNPVPKAELQVGERFCETDNGIVTRRKMIDYDFYHGYSGNDEENEHDDDYLYEGGDDE